MKTAFTLDELAQREKRPSSFYGKSTNGSLTLEFKNILGAKCFVVHNNKRRKNKRMICRARDIHYLAGLDPEQKYPYKILTGNSFDSGVIHRLLNTGLLYKKGDYFEISKKAQNGTRYEIVKGPSW